MNKIFSLDLRSLAIARILLGFLFFYDLWQRWVNRVPFYTDQGVLPRPDFIQNFQIPWKGSLLLFAGTPELTTFFCIIGIIFGLLFILGWRTRFSNIVCWILLASFQSRNPASIHGGDNVIRLLFFWFFFLPISAKYSIDSILQKTSEIKNEYFSIYTITFILQACFIYWFTTIYKWDPSWFKNFTALEIALNLDMFTKPLGNWLVHYPFICKVLTVLTMFVEGLGTFFLFVPDKKQWSRLFGVTLFILLHLGIFLTFHLGVFAPACIILWIAILPSSFWNRMKKYVVNQDKYQAYYDKDCFFCIKTLEILKMIFLLPNLKCIPAQGSEYEKVITEEKTWILIANGEQYKKMSGVKKLLSLSSIKLLLIPFYIFCFGGDFLYQMIAKSRPLLSSIIKSIGYSRVRLKTNKVDIVFATFIIGLVFAWNIEGLVGAKKFDIRSPFTEIAFIFQLNQQWNMFAPNPMKDDGWMISKAHLPNGTQWDILNEREYTEERPNDLADMYPNVQWHKYLVSIWFRNNAQYRKYFGAYLCRKWNMKNPESKIDYLEVYYMLEKTLPDITKAPVQKTQIWNHYCY